MRFVEFRWYEFNPSDVDEDHPAALQFGPDSARVLQVWIKTSLGGAWMDIPVETSKG
jgi:hypothetical protein